MSPGIIARKNRFPYFRPVSPSRKLLVRMDTTNYCNLRCSMCPMRLSDGDPERNWHHMEQDVFDGISSEVFPLARTVGISCGAEPLVNPRFTHHLRALYESGVPYREMVTNGTLLTEGIIGELLEYPPTSLFVSVDGATGETHGRIRDGADLSHIISMLRVLTRLKGKRRFPMIGLSTTLQRDNYRELEGIVSLAADVSASSCGVVPLVPYQGLNTIDRVIDADSPEVAEHIRRAGDKAEKLGIHFHLSRNVSRGGIPHPCPYLESTVYIDPDGSIFPCPYWNTENPLGNVMDGFQGIWRGETYERLREGRFEKGDNCLACPEITRGTREVIKGKQ